jgi:hypothetical protein
VPGRAPRAARLVRRAVAVLDGATAPGSQR